MQSRNEKQSKKEKKKRTRRRRRGRGGGRRRRRRRRREGEHFVYDSDTESMHTYLATPQHQTVMCAVEPSGQRIAVEATAAATACCPGCKIFRNKKRRYKSEKDSEVYGYGINKIKAGSALAHCSIVFMVCFFRPVVADCPDFVGHPCATARLSTKTRTRKTCGPDISG